MRRDETIARHICRGITATAASATAPLTIRLGRASATRLDTALIYCRYLSWIISRRRDASLLVSYVIIIEHAVFAFIVDIVISSGPATTDVKSASVQLDRQALTKVVVEVNLEACMIALCIDNCLTTLGHAARERAQ